MSAENGATPIRLELALTPDQEEALAQRVAELLAGRQPLGSPSTWLDAEGAGEHLCCSRDRIHDLVASGRLEPRRDGRRLLFRRADLDAYLERSA
jgi:excisionase family DNA binding protein